MTAAVRALAFAATVAALALAPAASSRPGKDGGTFRTAVSVPFLAVDPGLYGLEYRILRPACEGLMVYPDKRLPAGLRLVPDAAESNPRVSGDRRTYTFTIRKGMRFSTGAPLTARDFRHALERILDQGMKSDSAGLFMDVVGARQMLAGKTSALAGVIARGRTLRLKLTRPVPDFPARLSLLCAVPSSLPVDPEGAKPPLPSPAPYYVSEFVPGTRVVMERNPYYRGARSHHVDRITVDLQADASALDDVAAGRLDWVIGTPNLSGELGSLVRRYGVNRSRLFVEPDALTRMFLMNTASPLFRNNLALRKALNFAVDRSALAHEFGRYAAVPTDHYLPSVIPGAPQKHIYPLSHPNLRAARALARGHTRSGRGVLYTCSERPDCIALAQIFQQNARAIGLELRIKQFPLEVMFQKIASAREPYDIAYVGYISDWNDPEQFLGIFRSGEPENFAHLHDAGVDRLLARARALSGPARYRAYGRLDLHLVRDVVPAVGAINTTSWAFVSSRVGCVTMNPGLDVEAVCLK